MANYVFEDDPQAQVAKYVLEPLGMETKTPDQRTFYQQAAQGATGAIEAQGGPLAGSVAQFVIPQNEAELGAALGTLGVGGLAAKAGLTGIKAAASRVGGAALGSAGGAALSGEDPASAAIAGGLGATTGEVAAPAVGWIMRSAPGMKQKINSWRSAQIGEVIESKVPPLAGARDPHTLDQMARDFNQGKGSLFTYYKALTDNLERKIGPNNLHIPELAGPENIKTATAIREQITANQGADPRWIAQMQDRANALESVPIRDVMDELKHAGHYGFGGNKSNPNTRTIVGQEPRMEYADLIQKTKDELTRLDPTGALAKQFEDNRSMAAAGFTFLKMLQPKQAFLRYPKDVQLNIPYLQEYVNQNQTEIAKKLGPDAFAKLKETLWPGGAKMGTRDMPAIGAGNVEDAAMETLRGVGGSPRIITSPIRSLLPNIGAQYAGKAPFTPSQGTRTIADLVAEKGLNPVTSTLSDLLAAIGWKENK